MDIIVGLTCTRWQHYSIWVIVDQMMKLDHFIPIKVSYLAEDYSKFYLSEMVRFHEVPLSTISNRGTQFTSKFWKSFQRGLGTRVKFSTSFHLQTDWQPERRRDLEFDVHNWVYLKISPKKDVMRFGKRGKHIIRYVGPYQILRHFGKVAYELDLPTDLASVHPVFDVSLSKEMCGDLTSIVPLEGLVVK
ncbi:hypothetical protein MTR67_001779 [Solanum verrucosum]|uniref:Tf2-1-like SH3-like domain-containing protein n=1 Tax=Solanum verrucosum TaxID=315347 RepID=A0AAF0T857_SOLVR|nr:hypothetical protein MTR67_001779 [Solanum verrucosum]